MKRSGPITSNAMPKRTQPLRRVSRRKLLRDRQWWKTRRWVEGRADGRCEIRTEVCEHRGTEAHHLLPRSQGGPDTLDNLAWTCSACHRFLHAHPALSYERGWLRKAVA
jgi:hypothetical protein